MLPGYQNPRKFWNSRLFCPCAMYVLCACLAHVYDAACMCLFLLRVLKYVREREHVPLCHPPFQSRTSAADVLRCARKLYVHISFQHVLYAFASVRERMRVPLFHPPLQRGTSKVERVCSCCALRLCMHTPLHTIFCLSLGGGMEGRWRDCCMDIPYNNYAPAPRPSHPLTSGGQNG